MQIRKVNEKGLGRERNKFRLPSLPRPRLFLAAHWKSEEGNSNCSVATFIRSYRFRPLIISVDKTLRPTLLLVLVLVPRGFSPVTPVFPSPQKPTFSNSNSIWHSRVTGLSVILLSVTLVK